MTVPAGGPISAGVSAVPDAFELYRRGDFERAEDEARGALAESDHAALRHLLGVLLCRRGAIGEGADELGRALDLAPAHPAIRISYVRALIDLGRAGEALRHARRPAPGPAARELWQLRAEAAEAAGELAERTEALHHAELEAAQAELARRPEDVGLRLHQARLLGALARDTEAEAIYRAILDADAANTEAVHELGLILERNNRLGEVRTLVDDAVAAGADRGGFALLEALLAWRDGDPQEALDWLGKADAAREPVRVKLLEARVRDALGDVAGAFRAAKEKNRAVPDYAQWRRRSASYRDGLRQFSSKITPDWAAGFSPASPGPHRPLAFLVGFPRSGTTLLDTFLMGHSGIAVLEEVPVLGLVAERIGALERIAELDEFEVEELRRFYLERVARSLPEVSAGLVVDKLPLNLLYAPLIYRLFPDTRVIFAQRHPCDCVLSGFFQGFAMNPAMASFLDIDDAADLYDAALDIWTRSRSVLPIQVHTIAYERLVEEPEPELRRLVEFLGLDWEQRMLDHRGTARERGTIGTPSYDQVTEPITTRSVDRWRRYEAQLAPALPVLLPWAERLGYPA